MYNKAGISVLMTAYNAEQFIAEAIRSVLAQTFSDFEFIIINDGSTDRTLAIIQSFTDPRIRCLTQENLGIAAALNYGLAEAKGEYIARFDADDICYPHRLETQYGFLRNSPDHVIVGSSVDYIDQDGEFVFTFSPPAFTNQEIQEVKLRTCPFIHSGVLYNKDVVKRKGGYNHHAHSFEDHLLWLSILGEGKAINLPQSLIKVRLNPGSMTIDERWRPRQFHRIKNKALRTQSISAWDGQQLLKIIGAQNVIRIKEGAYYSLLAKKFLWNNYQPQKARKNLKMAMGRNRLHWKSYCFYLISFLPQPVLQKWYRVFKSPETLTTHFQKKG
ncbi:MAG TPA: glycosyltransferase [Chitinophagaceae bacterium]|nr:glycosyltransferase [Chitinophagaceae bacterium]